VSNQPGVAPVTDPNLVNAWGLVALATSPWWVSDNGTGDSSLFNAMGQPVIASGGSTNFVTVPLRHPAPRDAWHANRYRRKHQHQRERLYDHGRRQIGTIDFIFATLDGTISGWNPAVGIVNPATGATHATIGVDRSSAGAVYTGLAIATNQAGQTFLYAADGGPNRRVDMFDGTFGLVKSFDDPAIPRNFTAYGIQTVNDRIWVTFTALNKAQGGFVDVLTQKVIC